MKKMYCIALSIVAILAVVPLDYTPVRGDILVCGVDRACPPGWYTVALTYTTDCEGSFRSYNASYCRRVP
jgi:hypothetical protein